MCPEPFDKLRTALVEGPPRQGLCPESFDKLRTALVEGAQQHPG
jgi:hypothetical protein